MTQNYLYLLLDMTDEELINEIRNISPSNFKKSVKTAIAAIDYETRSVCAKAVMDCHGIDRIYYQMTYIEKETPWNHH